MKLQLFQSTIKEYLRFAEQLPYEQTTDISHFEKYNEFTYVAIQTRLILLRKYVSETDVVNTQKVINAAIEKFAEDSEYLNQLLLKYNEQCAQSVFKILPDGTSQDLYQSIEDIIYGLYLHADINRIQRLIQTKETFHFYSAEKFVTSIEPILIELHNYLSSKGITAVTEENKDIAPVICFNNNNVSRSIKGSPYWSNLIGHDTNDEDVVNIAMSWDNESICVFILAKNFLDALKEKTVSIEKMMNFIYLPTMSDWGDFSQIKELYNKISNPGISTYIRFNDKKDVAYVRLLPNVVESFIISDKQIISDINELTIVKDESLNEWRVFAFGSPINPYVE